MLLYDALLYRNSIEMGFLVLMYWSMECLLGLLGLNFANALTEIGECAKTLTPNFNWISKKPRR